MHKTSLGKTLDECLVSRVYVAGVFLRGRGGVERVAHQHIFGFVSDLLATILCSKPQEKPRMDARPPVVLCTLGSQ